MLVWVLKAGSGRFCRVPLRAALGSGGKFQRLEGSGVPEAGSGRFRRVALCCFRF